MTASDRQSDARPSPVFVLGSGRSGTTLVRLMLTAHPSIGIPPEGTFMMDLYRRWYRGGRPINEPVESFCDAVMSSDRFGEWKIDRDNLLARLTAVNPKTYANLVDAVYVEYLATLDANKSRWGDKNIDYVLELPRVIRLFPDARIIHVIRDGRDVLASYKNVKFGPKGALGVAMFWRKRVQTGRRVGRTLGATRYYELQYERLVAHPEDECRRVCAFLDEAFDPQMLNFHELNREKELVPAHRLQWHANTLKPVTTARTGRWREQLSPSEVRTFETIAGEALREFGYEPLHEPATPAQKAALIGAWSAWLVRGLRRRIGEQLRTAPPAGPVNPASGSS